MAMQKLETLLRQILPLVLPCPKSMALENLKIIAVDFCRESGVWNGRFTEAVEPGQTIIPLEIPANAVIEKVYSFKVNDEKSSLQYESGRREIVLNECLPDGSCVEIGVILRPLRTADELPEEILEEYGDILVCGTLAKLKSMSGQKVEWSDPNGAQTHYGLYLEGCARAKAKKYRKRFGCGVQYINIEEI